jgi:glycosyltransferase involved in cell wall biosynthesis
MMTVALRGSFSAGPRSSTIHRSMRGSVELLRPLRHGATRAGRYCIAVRIAHVVPRGERPASGVLTVNVHLSAALARRGHHVDLWQLHDWDATDYADQRRVLDRAGVEQVATLAHVPTVRLGAAARALAQQRRIDLIHLHGGFNPANTAIARACVMPYVFSPHSAYDGMSLRRSRHRKFLYAAMWERRMLRRAAAVVALTESEASNVRVFGRAVAIDVIPNGVAIASDGVDRAVFRRELSLAPGVPLAVFVGRLDVFRKGLDALVRAIAEAPDWTLALVGPRFRDVDRLEALIARLGVSSRVNLVGERQGAALHEALAAADVFVLPSRWEGQSMALLEALAVGRAAIVSPEVERTIGVAEAGAGWVSPREELGPTLRLVQAAGEEERRARNAAAFALARRHDWAGVAERYEATYARAAGSRDSVAR